MFHEPPTERAKYRQLNTHLGINRQGSGKSGSFTITSPIRSIRARGLSAYRCPNLWPRHHDISLLLAANSAFTIFVAMGAVRLRSAFSFALMVLVLDSTLAGRSIKMRSISLVATSVNGYLQIESVARCLASALTGGESCSSMPWRATTRNECRNDNSVLFNCILPSLREQVPRGVPFE